MRVHIDPAGRGDQPVAVELTVPLRGRAADIGDDITVDGDVARDGRRPGSVDDAGPPDHKIMHGE